MKTIDTGGPSWLANSMLGRPYSELSIPLFSIQDETGRVLDVRESFCPNPRWLTCLIRLILLVWSLEVLYYDLHDVFMYPYFYMAFLSQWSFALTVIYYFSSCLVAFGNFAAQPKSLAPDESPHVTVRLQWALFTTAAMIQTIATFIFWVFFHHVFFHVIGKRVRYPCLMKHGVFLAFTLIEGLVYSRIPVRAKHCVFPMLVLQVYTVWTLIANFSSISNPFHHSHDPNQDDDSVYPEFNFKRHPAPTTFMYIMSTLIFAPTFFLVIWALSAWSWRRGTFDGSHRRHIGERVSSDKAQ